MECTHQRLSPMCQKKDKCYVVHMSTDTFWCPFFFPLEEKRSKVHKMTVLNRSSLPLSKHFTVKSSAAPLHRLRFLSYLYSSPHICQNELASAPQNSVLYSTRLQFLYSTHSATKCWSDQNFSKCYVVTRRQTLFKISLADTFRCQKKRQVLCCAYIDRRFSVNVLCSNLSTNTFQNLVDRCFSVSKKKTSVM